MCSLAVVCRCVISFFFFKQKTAYEMRISDWSSDVCSSDLTGDQPSQPGAMRHDIAPQIGRRRIAVLEEDRIAGPLIDIGHAPALDLNEFLLAKWLCAEAHRYSP